MNEEKKIRKVIREEVEKILESQYNDGEHAVQKLKQIRKFSDMLLNEISVGDELPEWVMDKFAVSASDLNDIYQYMTTDPDETESQVQKPFNSN